MGTIAGTFPYPANVLKSGERRFVEYICDDSNAVIANWLRNRNTIENIKSALNLFGDDKQLYRAAGGCTSQSSKKEVWIAVSRSKPSEDIMTTSKRGASRLEDSP